MGRIWVLAIVLAGSPLQAGEVVSATKPELRGVIVEEAGRRFGLFIPESGQTGWGVIGQSVGGWKLKEYLASEDVLLVVKEGREEKLPLSKSTPEVYHTATLADAKAVLVAMKYEQRILHGAPFKSLTRRALFNAGLTAPSTEQAEAFHKQVAPIFDYKKMEALMMPVLSELYTREELAAQAGFYASDVGQALLNNAGVRETEDTLRALEAFYETPLGAKVREKEPKVNTTMRKAMDPFISEAESAIAVEAQKFVAEQKASAK